jgi:hypothetical protein
MNALLVSTVVALGIGQPTTASADGKWVIVYAEEGGRRNNAWEQRLATCMGGTLSYEDTNGKKLSLALKFGPHQSLDVTVNEAGGTAEKAWHGVYMLGQDYLCISLNKGARKGGGGATGAGAGGAAAAQPPAGVGAGLGAGAHDSSADFMLILRRLRTGKGTEK